MSTYPTTPNSVSPIASTLPGQYPDGWYVGSPKDGTAGTVTLNGATNVVVTTAKVTANSQIIYTLNTIGGTQGAQPVTKAKTAGTSFAVAGTASDTSVYNWMILEPAVV